MRSTINSLAGMCVWSLLLSAGLATAAGPDLRLVDAMAGRMRTQRERCSTKVSTSTRRERMASRRFSGQRTGMIWERPVCY